MGQRANLLIVGNGGYRLYYSYWCANTLPRDLFWGPDYAIKFIQAQREVDESGWLDEIWAEGAAVVDRDKNVLLFFGGQDERHNVLPRRVYLKMLRRVWRGWQIRWAVEGIADIADYVGYPRSKVLSEPKNEPVCSLSPPEQRDWTDIIGSFRRADGSLCFYPLAGEVESYLGTGPALVSECGRQTGFDELHLDQWIKVDFPTGGFHIDVVSRTVDFWTATDSPDAHNRVSCSWPNWRVRWHHDAFETQLASTDGLLQFPVPPSEQLLAKQIADALLCDHTSNPVNTLLQITDQDRAEGKDVQINPWALRDDRLEIPAETRRRIVELALDAEDDPNGCTTPRSGVD